MIGVGGVGFQPEQLPGLAYRLRSDVGITQSGGKVSAIANQGFAGNSPVQASGALQPAYTANVNNSLPGVVFNGTNNRLAFPSNITGNTGTALLVYAGVGNNSTYAAPWAFDGPAMYFGFGSDANQLIVYAVPSGEFNSGLALSNTPTLVSLDAVTTPSNVLSLRRNGGAAATTPNGFLNARGASSFGSDAPFANPAAFTLQDFLFYTTNLTTIQRKWVERYLAVRYALTVTA